MKIIEIGIAILSAILMLVGLFMIEKDEKCEFFSFVNSLYFKLPYSHIMWTGQFFMAVGIKIRRKNIDKTEYEKYDLYN